MKVLTNNKNTMNICYAYKIKYDTYSGEDILLLEKEMEKNFIDYIINIIPNIEKIYYEYNNGYND